MFVFNKQCHSIHKLLMLESKILKSWWILINIWIQIYLIFYWPRTQKLVDPLSRDERYNQNFDCPWGCWSSLFMTGGLNYRHYRLKLDNKQTWHEKVFTNTITAHVQSKMDHNARNHGYIWHFSTCSRSHQYTTSYQVRSKSDNNFIWKLMKLERMFPQYTDAPLQQPS